MKRTYLGARNTQETNRHQHTADGDLVITKLDTIKVLHAQTVRRNETVQGEDLVHLNSRDQGTPSLPDDMSD